MRVAALCVAACLVTSASITSSELANFPVDFVGSASAASATENPDVAVIPSGKSEQRPDTVSVSSDRAAGAALSKAELCETAVQVAQANNLPVPFFTRLIRQESGFDPRVVSSAGARGIAQFMPRTAAARGLADPFEPIGALAASGKFLAELVSRFGNLGLAAAAYNAGPKRVQDWIARRGKLPAETRNYVLSITGRVAEAWTGVRAGQAQVERPSPAGCPVVAHNEVGVASPQKDTAHEQRTSPPRASADARPVKEAYAEHRSLPRPSRFVIGRPVPAAIKAIEARVLAKGKWLAGARRRHRGLVRVASIR